MESNQTTRRAASHGGRIESADSAALPGAVPVDLPVMPECPTLVDILTLRLHVPVHGLPFPLGPHCVQSATLALRAGMDEEIVMACLVHDIGLGLTRPDHGWWGAQLIEPYVSARTSWAIRYHQALRFYPDPQVGYEYPQMYNTLFGPDYEPPRHIAAAYRYARNHSWYMAARSVTLFDEYSFDPDAPAGIEPLLDIIGRNFRQPSGGLGNDGNLTAHMWRTIIDPRRPL
jgi:hypothetical protein